MFSGRSMKGTTRKLNVFFPTSRSCSYDITHFALLFDS